MEELVLSREMSRGRRDHVAAKQKGEVRIVHIVAPEVINTDAASFRDLVQRLTGKQAISSSGGHSRGKTKPVAPVPVKPESSKPSAGRHGSSSGEWSFGVGGEEESGVFSSSLDEFDAFVQGLICEYPHTTTSHACVWF